MRGIKAVSIRKYITTCIIALLLVMLTVMLVFINIFANMAISYDVRKSMSREVHKNCQNVEFRNGKLVAGSEFLEQYEGMYFLVAVEKEGVCIGNYPQGFTMEETQQKLGLSLIRQDKKSYYVFDRVDARLTKQLGKTVIGRCIVRKENIESEYRTIKNLSYLSIPVFLMIGLLVGLFIAGKIANPLRQMCAVAETIGRNDDLSQRMEYEGGFREIAILSETNNRMLERLEQMYEVQKRFNSNVAHELRTPLTVLSAQCEYAKEQCGNPEEMRESLEVINRQIKKCSGIVSQLLQLNKLEQNQIKLDLEYADIDEIVRAICEEEEINYKDNVEFRLNLGNVWADADVILMTSLIQNLISNAIKYSEMPATVEISTSQTAEKNIICVHDYGYGIAKEELKNIFIPFYRADKARNSEGYGLGLALAEKIALLHGGCIQAESELGKGSSFTLELPIKFK